MRRRVLEHNGSEPAQQTDRRRSKLDPNGKCGVAVKKQPQQQPQQQLPSQPPVEAKAKSFLKRKSNDELVVHWTRAESSQYPPIKLLSPW